MSAIVVGVDFTPCSASALRQAMRIAAWRRATVQAVHAIEPLVVMDLEQALSPLRTDIRPGLIRDAGKAWTELSRARADSSSRWRSIIRCRPSCAA